MFFGRSNPVLQRISILTKAFFTDIRVALGMLIGLYSVNLVLRVPATVCDVLRCLWPWSGKVTKEDFWGFAIDDHLWRPFYQKIAHNYRTNGPASYFWDDSLGFPGRGRFFQNYLTYWLYGILGDRTILLLGYVGLIVAAAWLGAGAYGVVAGLGIAALVAGSPVVVHCFTLRGKPEMVFYPLLLISFYLFATGAPLAGGLIWSAVTIFNFPSSAMLAIAAGPCLATVLILSGGLTEGLLGVAPGIVANVVRFDFFRDLLYPQKIVSAQSRIRVPSLFDDVLACLPLLSAVAFNIWGGYEDGSGLVLAATVTVFYVSNKRRFKFNDFQSFDITLFILTFGYVCAHPSGMALMACLIGAYRLRVHLTGAPFHQAFSVPDGPETPAQWERLLNFALARLSEFPGLQVRSVPRSPALRQFLDQIAPRSRVLLETHWPNSSQYRIMPDPYFRTLWCWCTLELSRRNIHFLSGEYTFLWEADLAEKHLRILNAEQSIGEDISDVCDALGAEYFIALTDLTTSALLEQGFVVAATLDTTEIDPEERRLMYLPAMTFRLLTRASGAGGAVSPSVDWRFQRGMLRFPVQAGQAYQMRFRHRPEFRATIDGEPVSIEAYAPLPGTDLHLMRVLAPKSGELRLEYPVWPLSSSPGR